MRFKNYSLIIGIIVVFLLLNNSSFAFEFVQLGGNVYLSSNMNNRVVSPSNPLYYSVSLNNYKGPSSFKGGILQIKVVDQFGNVTYTKDFTLDVANVGFPVPYKTEYSYLSTFVSDTVAIPLGSYKFLMRVYPTLPSQEIRLLIGTSNSTEYNDTFDVISDLQYQNFIVTRQSAATGEQVKNLTYILILLTIILVLSSLAHLKESINTMINYWKQILLLEAIIFLTLFLLGVFVPPSLSSIPVNSQFTFLYFLVFSLSLILILDEKSRIGYFIKKHEKVFLLLRMFASYILTILNFSLLIPIYYQIFVFQASVFNPISIISFITLFVFTGSSISVLGIILIHTPHKKEERKKYEMNLLERFLYRYLKRKAGKIEKSQKK